jgi:hypothetical protein
LKKARKYSFVIAIQKSGWGITLKHALDDWLNEVAVTKVAPDDFWRYAVLGRFTIACVWVTS